jgi:hypothetical protein
MTAGVRNLSKAMQGERLSVRLGAYAESARELALQFRPTDAEFGRKCF